MLIKASDLFKGNWEDKRVLFAIVEDDVQIMAERKLKRKLTEDELYRASKGVEFGLSEGLDVVLETAIDIAVEK